jgi:hypothetical protein
LLSGGALMMVRVPSSEIKVTPMPCVNPRLPLTMEHFPVSAGASLAGRFGSHRRGRKERDQRK